MRTLGEVIWLVGVESVRTVLASAEHGGGLEEFHAGGIKRVELRVERSAAPLELVALDVAETPDGLKLRIRRSKTDQEAVGRTVGVPYGSQRQTCPVRAWGDWLAASGITEGPAWRPVTRHGHLGDQRLSDRAVSEIVKRSAEQAGLDPADYSGHSLRAGLITAAAAAGVPTHVIQRQSGHKDARGAPRLRPRR